jgi:osmotically-inducible protein OsmY
LVLAAALLLSLMGCLSGHKRATVQRTAYLDDKVIAARAAQKLKQNSRYRFPQVEVHATNGVVILTGTVETTAQRDQAAELARQVESARQVENRLEVAGQPRTKQK